MKGRYLQLQHQLDSLVLNSPVVFWLEHQVCVTHPKLVIDMINIFQNGLNPN